MVSYSTKRTWKQHYEKTTPNKTRNRIRKEIQKITKTKEGVTTQFLQTSLNHLPNFIGVFSIDQILKLQLDLDDCFVVNLDFSTQPGSHWIAIKLSQDKCFVIDSLGGALSSNYFKSFISKLSNGRKVIYSPALQQLKSNLCGFYCLFFLLYLEFATFSNLCKSFTSNLPLNDNKLLDFF